MKLARSLRGLEHDFLTNLNGRQLPKVALFMRLVKFGNGVPIAFIHTRVLLHILIENIQYRGLIRGILYCVADPTTAKRK